METAVITLRQLTALDAAHYQTLRIESLAGNPESFLFLPEQEQQKKLIAYQSELQAVWHPPVFGYHGIFIGETLAGYARLEQPIAPKQQHLAFLYNLYVTPQYRRQQLAKRIVTHLIHLLEKYTAVEQLFVTCNAKNTAGCHFYQSLGFTNWGRKPNAIKWQNNYDDELEWVLAIAR